jgi:ATP-dependent helicase/nuclease subunit A
MQRQFTARDDHLRMLRLSRQLLACWRDCKRDHALADMTDLETCAVALLSDPVVSGWVQERLDARVRHLLIDEFQDTSPLQWHALHHWLSAYAGAGGGASGQRALSLFVVGDPKQSIYRFRRAEPRVFAAACDFVREAMAGVVLACDHTRRSAPALIGGLNTVFDQACSDGEFAGFRDHSTEIGTPAGEIWSLPEVLRGEREAATAAGAGRWRDSLTERRVEPEEVRRMAEARHVAAAIAEMLAPGELAPRQIMVLARKRSVLLLVEAALRECHIACVAAQDLRLIALPEVLDLVAVVDLLASPGHDLSLARALKSPLFSADDGDLLALSLRAAAQGSHWHAALSDWDDAPPALARARRLLDRWARAARELPPHDLLDRIVAEGDALARFVAAAPAEQRDAAAQAISALLWHALTLDEGRYATPYNFVRALRKGLQTATATSHVDAVQLLTVHGAKGLEADVVFIVDTDAEASMRSEPGVLVAWPIDAARPQVAAFVANLNQPPPSLAELHADEQALQARESLNLLYVAMTRARHRLVYSRTEPHRASAGPSWWSRVAALAEPWLPAPPLPGAGPALTTLAIPTLPQWRGLAAQNPAMKSDANRDDLCEPAQDTELTRRGRALHRALEWATAVTGLGSAGPAIARRALALAAAQEFGLGEADSALIEASLSRIVDNVELTRFFDPACCAWAANEASLADGNEVLRMDRVLQLKAEYGGEWWVLDYKLGSTADRALANQRQLSRYRRLVAALQPGQVVRAAWITSEGRLIEWLG